MTEELRYQLIKTKAAGYIVIDVPAAEATNVPIKRYEVVSRHRSWEAANAARAKILGEKPAKRKQRSDGPTGAEAIGLGWE